MTRMLEKACIMQSTPSFLKPQTQELWQLLDCRLPGVEAVFQDCTEQAFVLLNQEQILSYIESARVLGKLGRGAAPVLAWLETWPEINQQLEADITQELMLLIKRMQLSPNSNAIAPLIESLLPVSKRLLTAQNVRHYLSLIGQFMDQTTGSIHGRQKTLASPALLTLLKQAAYVLKNLSLLGFEKWMSYGARAYAHHPDQQIAYFNLLTPDSKAVLQSERKGLLLNHAERTLDCTMRAMWQLAYYRVPLISTDTSIALRPCLQDQTIGLPDLLEARLGVSALQRYQLMQAHIAGHIEWSQSCIADNWSPAQRLAVEWFEDARIDSLLLARFPGLRPSLLRLHPTPLATECDELKQACLRHRLARWSRSVLDASYVLEHPVLERYRDLFLQELNLGTSSTEKMAQLALLFVAHTRLPSDQFSDVYFANTELDWRDDNRHLWRFIEEGDEEESFDKTQSKQSQADEASLPPRHYPEWDYISQCYRPDWVSVYEHAQPLGNAAKTDELLARHNTVAKKLKKIMDGLKPQNRQRLRYQEQGNELDLDVALGAWIDFKNGQTPSPLIHQHHQTNDRDISVQVLLDLSTSLSEKIKGQDKTVLELSQEAVALLAWVMHEMKDNFAIAGFHSNTRHEVRYLHIKGFSQPWADEAKSRLSSMQASYSTRMGAALRHAAHYLGSRKSARKLMLVITDGQPSDVDCPDPQWLVQDARKAVQELQAQGIYTWCINLDAFSDQTVKDIYGARYTIVDHLEKLPDSLAKLFIALTGKAH